MCDKCKVIKRKGKILVICDNPKHNNAKANRCRGGQFALQALCGRLPRRHALKVGGLKGRL